jgi:murein DD-endopeptidase MepM/ murein hydrolase activator NlpD
LLAFPAESFAKMFTASIIFIIAFPISIYYFYTKPKHYDLIQFSVALVLCNAFIQLILIFNTINIDASQKNIDYLPVASIVKKSQSENYISQLSDNKKQNNAIISENKETVYDDSLWSSNSNLNPNIGCDDCDAGVLEYNPDFTNGPLLSDFIWPAKGRIIQPFHSKMHIDNDGINISLPIGTKIKAVGDGTISYVGDELKNYGKVVIIKHNNGFTSIYAHNSVIKVNKGDHVKCGDIIAESGKSGRVPSPQLHFELRKAFVPVDPFKFIPKSNNMIDSN